MSEETADACGAVPTDVQRNWDGGELDFVADWFLSLPEGTRLRDQAAEVGRDLGEAPISIDPALALSMLDRLLAGVAGSLRLLELFVDAAARAGDRATAIARGLIMAMQLSNQTPTTKQQDDVLAALKRSRPDRVPELLMNLGNLAIHLELDVAERYFLDAENAFRVPGRGVDLPLAQLELKNRPPSIRQFQNRILPPVHLGVTPRRQGGPQCLAVDANVPQRQRLDGILSPPGRPTSGRFQHPGPPRQQTGR